MSVIRTERLLGRPCRADDTPHVAALFGEPAVRVWTSPPGLDWTPERFAAVAARLAAHWPAHGWGARLWFAEDRLVGIAGLQFALIDGRGAVEVAFAVLPARQRQGYAGEALAAILAEAPVIARELRAAVVPGNAPSLALLGRHGFVGDGRVEEDGRPLEVLVRRFP